MDALWLISVAPLAAFVMTVFNAFAWPRGKRVRRGPDDAAVSALIPARNEEATIEAAVRSALSQDVLEVLVYDDQSTDRTPEILASIAADDPRLRVVNGVELPAGWVGKPHACHRLYEAARGDVLLFMDADVELARDSLERIAGIFSSYKADVVTAVPRQQVGGFVERLVLPMLHVTYSSWLPMPLVWTTSDPRFLAANGQLLAVSRRAYEQTSGFEGVRDAVVDDMAFCAAQKRAGNRVVFADGHHIASCRMYTSPRAVWEGFSKNIYEGLGSPLALFFVVALYLATFVLPWLLLPFGGAFFWPAMVGVTANILQRLLLMARHSHAIEGPLLVPLAALALCAIAVNSWVWHLRNNIQWSGRSYARKAARGG